MTETSIEDYAEKIKNGMSDAIELTTESGEAYTKINDVFKDVPAGKVGMVNLQTGDVKILGDMDQQVATVLYENQQHDSGGGGTSHIIKYESLYDLINAEPAINFGLSLWSELPVAYGYRFQKPAPVKELSKLNTVAQVSDEYWTEWSKFVNLDHIIKMSIHSLKAMGVLYIEKTYDSSGLNKRGWGIRKLRVLSPDAMYVVVDSKGNVVGFIQWAGETHRRFYMDDEQAKKLIKMRRVLVGDQKKFMEEHPGSVSIPRHKIIFATYNAYYDDTVYGFGNLVPLVSYSKSKIGIQQRVLRMIENSASSFVVFKYGSENYMVSGKSATKVMADISKAKNPKYIVVPFYFDVQAIEMGGAIDSVAPVMDYFKDEQMTGLGIPMILMRPGGSGEGANIQLEAFTRQMKYLQNILSNIYRSQLLPEVLLGDPNKSAKLMTDDPRMYPYMRPSVFHKIPEIKWNVIESVADRRLRLDVDAKHGAISFKEYRQEIGRMGKVAKGDEMPLISMQMEGMENEKELADMEQETAKMQMKHAEKMANIEMKKAEQEMANADKGIEQAGKQLDVDVKRLDLTKKQNAEGERSAKVKDTAAAKKKKDKPKK